MQSTASHPTRPPADRKSYLVGQLGMLVALGLGSRIMEIDEGEGGPDAVNR